MLNRPISLSSDPNGVVRQAYINRYGLQSTSAKWPVFLVINHLKKHEIKIAKKEEFPGAVKVQCAYEEILYTDKKNISKNIEIMNSWKVFTSKGNGGAGLLGDDKSVSILGKPYVAGPDCVCTDSLIPIGCFKTKEEAVNLQKYMNTKFLRFAVGILKTSQNVYQNVYQFVPMQDFTNKSDIDWSNENDF